MKLSNQTRRGFMKNALGTAGVVLSAGPLTAGTNAMRSPVEPDPGRKLKVGIVGIGARCREHIDCMVNRSDAFEILSLCDLRQEALDTGVKRSKGNPATFLDFREMLKHPGLNMIVITTPHFLHAPMAIDALNAGYDVLVEKPMAMTVAECNAMNEAARTNNRILMVTEQHRWQGNNVKVKELLDAGEIGEVQYIWAASFRGPWSPAKRWLSIFAESGGLLLSESSHDLDSFYWFLNSRVARASGMGGSTMIPGYDILDHCLVMYEYENGVKMAYGFSTTAPGAGGYRERVIFGSRGRLEYDRKGQVVVQYKYEPEGRQAEGPIEHDVSASMAAGGHIGTVPMYDHAVECLRNRTEPLTAGVVMTESVRVCVAGQDAVRQGKIINVRAMTG